MPGFAIVALLTLALGCGDLPIPIISIAGATFAL
jgi:hypothetical protein